MFHSFFHLLQKEYFSLFFFFNDPATTEIYTVMNTLSLHDALPIRGRTSRKDLGESPRLRSLRRFQRLRGRSATRDRKSTRLNSSHSSPSRMPSSARKQKKHTPTHHPTNTTFLTKQ